MIIDGIHQGRLVIRMLNGGRWDKYSGRRVDTATNENIRLSEDDALHSTWFRLHDLSYSRGVDHPSTVSNPATHCGLPAFVGRPQTWARPMFPKFGSNGARTEYIREFSAIIPCEPGHLPVGRHWTLHSQ